MTTVALTVALGALAMPAATAQAPAPGLVVGSGNFFSPIVGNLENAIAFYRDGLGLEVTGQPSNATDNAPLRNMFGLPDAQLRWTVARPAGVRQGVEIVEISGAGGRPLDRRITDPGAMTLVMSTADDLDEVVSRLRARGGIVISTPVASKTTGARLAVVRDPDDHFIELIAAGRDATPLPPRIRLTVQNLDKATALYRDGLGLRPTARSGVLEVQGSNLVIEFVASPGGILNVSGRIQDPGSTRLQLQVRDLDAAIQAIVRAGGRVVSTGGRPVELPGGRGNAIKAAIVQDPNYLFVVLIQAAS
jgi:predicted enzyme related to lactoylglutathione lyase